MSEFKTEPTGSSTFARCSALNANQWAPSVEKRENVCVCVCSVVSEHQDQRPKVHNLTASSTDLYQDYLFFTDAIKHLRLKDDDQPTNQPNSLITVRPLHYVSFSTKITSSTATCNEGDPCRQQGSTGGYWQQSAVHDTGTVID